MPSPLSNLLPDILPHVPGCSDLQAESALRRAVIDFYQRAKLYWVDLTPINIVADQASYTLPNPTDYQILHIRNGAVSNFPLHLSSEEQLDLEWTDLNTTFAWNYNYDGLSNITRYEDWRYAVSTLPGIGYQPTPNTLVLVGKPTVPVTAGLILKVVCVPVASITSIDDWIFNRYHYGLADGAVGLLKMMPKKPFSDKAGAESFLSSFEDAVGVAEGAALRSYGRNDQPLLRTKPCR